MNMYEFSKENVIRCEAPHGFNHKLKDWSLSDWMVALAGEVGEAANVVKKLNRHLDGIPGNDKEYWELRGELTNELADVYCYLDLLAQAAEIDLPKAIRQKFDKVSERIGYAKAPPSAKPDAKEELLRALREWYIETDGPPHGKFESERLWTLAKSYFPL